MPEIVARTLIRPPSARIGPVTPDERRATISASPVRGKYDTTIDRESAYEMLKKRAAQKTAEAAQKDSGGGLGGMLGGIFGGGSSRRMSTGEVVVKQVARSVAGQVGTQLGRALVRGILGSMRR